MGEGRPRRAARDLPGAGTRAARGARPGPGRRRGLCQIPEMTTSTHMVKANGLRFRALVDGPPDGDLFILMHGFPEGAESWSRQLPVLAAAGFLAVAPDMRGYGMTDAPEGVENYAIDHLVADAKALIESFGRT